MNVRVAKSGGKWPNFGQNFSLPKEKASLGSVLSSFLYLPCSSQVATLYLTRIGKKTSCRMPRNSGFGHFGHFGHTIFHLVHTVPIFQSTGLGAFEKKRKKVAI